MSEASLHTLQKILQRARQEISKVIIGQQEVIDKTLIAVFTTGHALIEGVPGVGKTVLVRTIGQVLGCETNRIQFTPDLMPTDITGTNIYNLHKQRFDLVKGPIFTTFLLADEINRAPAKTQSALLQAMQEHQVSIDRDTHPLSPHFTVFATQNPVEYEGTYPLPEAQKDRFLLKIAMKEPDREDELQLAARTLGKDSPERVLDSGAIQPVLAEKQLALCKQLLGEIVVKEELIAYVVDLIRASRQHESVMVGAGPRATQGLLLACRAAAALDGRDFVVPDDVKELAVPVMEHRLVLRPEFEIEGLTAGEVVADILQQVEVPK
ncbi:AAA family ATPase [Candidatus Electrothrix sp.]|uniref:AAA family ATPase n=1 Tax=Candidatus Electrothrix sp. TaxID=2170559 RepID=UPI004057BECE